MTSETHRHRLSKPESLKVKEPSSEEAAKFSIASLGRLIGRHKRVTGGIITGVTLGAAGAAVAVENWLGLGDSGPKPVGTPTSISTETPGATPTPTESSTPFLSGRTATSLDQISYDEGLPDPLFNELSPSERFATFWTYAQDPENGLEAYAKKYVYILNNPSEQDNLPATISVDASPAQIVTIAAYAKNFAWSLPGHKGEKALAGAVYDTTNEAYRGAKGILEQHAQDGLDANGAAGLANEENGQSIGAFTIVKNSEKQKMADGTVYIDIVIGYTKTDGSPYQQTARFYYVTNGSAGMWLQGEAKDGSSL